MKNKKKNNKGFSLVELIVVMAIMAILAVTLAPRLLNYVDKARQANDREVINNIYTATQYALIDDTIFTAAIDAAVATPTSSTYPYEIDLGKGINGSGISTDTDQAYNVSTDGKTWTATSNLSSNKFIYELRDVMKTFKLQSTKVHDDAQILITIISATRFKVELFYDDDAAADYILDSITAS